MNSITVLLFLSMVVVLIGSRVTNRYMLVDIEEGEDRPFPNWKSSTHYLECQIYSTYSFKIIRKSSQDSCIPASYIYPKNIILLPIGEGDSRSLSLKPSNGVVDPAKAPSVVVEPKETQGIQYKLRGYITGFYFQIIYINIALI